MLQSSVMEKNKIDSKNTIIYHNNLTKVANTDSAPCKAARNALNYIAIIGNIRNFKL